jgi:Uri superfamily endonuclease
VYCLVMRLSRPCVVRAGRLGVRRLAKGWYVYVGSAKRGLGARVDRHLRREKRLRWHIDYLLTVAGVRDVWTLPWTEGAECGTNARIQAMPRAAAPWSRFGSSDCRCQSHLTWFPSGLAAAAAAGCARVVTIGARSGPPRERHLTTRRNGRILMSALRSGATKESS